MDGAIGEAPISRQTFGARRYLASLPVALATAFVARYALRAVLDRCGHPAVPLDDAFIHFQYARRLAEGHFFSYSAGQGYSSGATSLLWPALLAPFYAVGFRDLSIVWIAWFFGFWALFALALETYRLALPLVGAGAAAGAGAMVLGFGGYVWCAASGMEVVPLSWALAFGLRHCIEWWEAPAAERSSRRARTLLAIAFLAPLVRPEGAVVSVLVFVSLAFARAEGRERWLFPLALVGPLVMPMMNLLFTGRLASSTVTVKWLPGNPYYGQGAALAAAVADNMRLLVASILDGREWSAIFVPSGARIFALGGLAAIPVMGYLRRRPVRAALVLVMALALLVTCTYGTFLWNRLRYLWPFAFAWFVGLSCLARATGEIFGRIRPRFRVLGPVLSGVFAGALISHLGWTIDDLAESASAIDRQQVALGRWAAKTLPADARIGVNDVGAIGYLSGKETFDVVGLTTPGEARYWVAGAGSRFEHYERLFRAGAERMPTHFIVYPQWMACDALLGRELHAETVTDQTILGGVTMAAFTARYDLVGSGDAPSDAPAAELLDELDVADLESEAAHRYELGDTRETDDRALSYAHGERVVADGARLARTSDRFVLRSRQGEAATLVARFVADAATELDVSADGARVATVRIEGNDEWNEVAIALPAASSASPVAIAITSARGATFGSAHYWLYRAASAN